MPFVPSPLPLVPFIDDPTRISFPSSDSDTSEAESEVSFDGYSSTPPSEEEQQDLPGISKASVIGELDSERAMGCRSSVDFVAVLEENRLLRRASMDSINFKKKNRNSQASLESLRASERDSEALTPTGTVTPTASFAAHGNSDSHCNSGSHWNSDSHVNSEVRTTGSKSGLMSRMHSMQSFASSIVLRQSTVSLSSSPQRVLEEKEQILNLFKIDNMMEHTLGEEMRDSLMPQHAALGRVVKHIFCQIDPDKRETTQDGQLYAPLQAFVFRHASRLLKSQILSAFFMFLTIYMLFAPDLILLWANRELYGSFLKVNTVIFFLFLMEFVLFIFGQRKKYVFSANIVMDFLSLLSVLADSHLVSDLGDDHRQGATIMRMARSSRMTRLARMARVARVTRLIPRLLRFCRKDQMKLAKIVLLRRLWLIFCFLDTDEDSCVNSFDVKFFYLTIMQECGNIMQRVPDRLKLLSSDVRWLVSQKVIQEHHRLGFDGFLKIISGTGLGKTLEEHHQEDVAADRGVLFLTQALGDSTAMKVCIGIIILIGMLSVIDVERSDTSAEQGLAQLDGIARAWHTDQKSWGKDFLCQQIRGYTTRHKVAYIFLDGYTYWLHGHCLSNGVSKTEFDPLAHVDEIIEDSSLRRSEFIQACWKGCTSNMASLALVDNSNRNQTTALSGFYTTTSIIFLLLFFVHILNMGITKFSKTMLEPLRAISDDMTALACMDLVHIDKEIPDNDLSDRAVNVAEELQQLQVSFLSMKHAVRSWSKYVPPSVVERLFAAGIEANVGVNPCYASIFFCDIVGFDDICCGLPPQQVLALLSTVLETVAEVVHKNKGTLLEFIGDEVLAVFNTPNLMKHHAFRAVRSAYEVHNTVQTLPPVLTQDGTETKIKLRCGVNTTNLLAGNLGSSNRMKFGVLGDGVNLTARLKGLNSRYNSRTLISGHTLREPLCKRRFVTRPVDVVAVKGKKEPTRVYEVLQPMNQVDYRWMKEAAAKHSRAYRRYLSRHFEGAKVLFEKVSAIFQEHDLDDEPSRLLLSRCIAHMDKPPSADWDGVDRLTQKTFGISSAEEVSEALKAKPVERHGQDMWLPHKKLPSSGENL